MKDPYRSDETLDDGLLEVFKPGNMHEADRRGSLLKEGDELERMLEEKAAELARAEDALGGEMAKRECAEKALREAEKNYRILKDHAEEGVRIIQRMREQLQEANLRSTRGKTLTTAFLHDLKGPLALISPCAQFCMGNLPQFPTAGILIARRN